MPPDVTRHFILATAGHVDHGKTALVKALTGTDTDRLPEEKARGMTIQLGFANLRLASPSASTPPAAYDVGVVDVPGHEDFVKNMVAGVGSIDAALLVVASDDGWMPQTEEHLQILAYLGVRRGVVALTKSDLSPDVAAAAAGVRARLAGSSLADAPIVPTSVVTGAGLDELREALADVFSRRPAQPDHGTPRLPVDRVFTLKGVGTVVTGTLTGGTLQPGQEVVVQPAGHSTRVRTVQTHNHARDAAAPGSRVALSLPDLPVRASRGAGAERQVGRGDVVTVAAAGSSSRTIEVLLERSSRAAPAAGTPARPLRDGAVVRIHHGSAAVGARIKLLEAREIEPGGQAMAQLRLAAPLFALRGDRFVVRDWAEQHTLAGGVVLDLQPTPDLRRGDELRLAYLRAVAAAPDDAAVLLRASLARHGVVRYGDLSTNARFAAGDLDSAVAAAVAAGTARREGDFIVGADYWSPLRRRAEGEIDAWHAAHPEQAGMPLPALRLRLADAASGTQSLIDSLLRNLAEDGFLRVGPSIRRATHQPKLPARLQASGDRIRQQLARHAFDPPSRKDLARDDLAEQAMKFLVLNGEAVELGPDQVMGMAHYTRAIGLIRSHVRERGPATVADLKQALGSSRRVMVPLLERLDREAVTKRQGDRRTLG